MLTSLDRLAGCLPSRWPRGCAGRARGALAGEAAGPRRPARRARRPVLPVQAPSWLFLLKRFGDNGEGLGSIRIIRKIAFVVQPEVNSSVPPAADRSNGQKTTAENKAPRCSPGANPARRH